METLSNTSQGDSSVKSDDSSPQNESGRSSPPPKCAICLGTCKNKSFTDSCLHQFCFRCILRWSKVKTECPLCKQNFKSIIHNVRSNHQYEEYMVEERSQVEDIERIEFDNLNTQRIFRYRTTLTLPYRDSWAIEQFIRNYRARRPPPVHFRRHPSHFRRTVYRHNLWARPLPDFTGRFRDCAPEFYRYNDSQMHRLGPWLSRELHYLLNENVGHIAYVMTQIMDLLPQYHINSPQFRDAMHGYFGERTEHFLHELYCFASTPYDMSGYDRNVQYTTDSRVSMMINEVISSSDNEASDSTIEINDCLLSVPGDMPPGPSRVPAPVYPQTNITYPSTNDVIPIETITYSDSDDNSEVMVVGYIKPPHARTPEVVDLLESDSDVVIEDDPPAPITSTDQAQESQENRLVKLTLRQHTAPPRSATPRPVTSIPLPSPCPAADDTDDSSYTPPLPRKKRLHPQSDVSSSSSNETEYEWSSRSSTLSYCSDASSDSYKPRSKKSKRKKTKRKTSDRSRNKSKKTKSRSSTKTKTKKTETKTRNRKSDSGKGVKSSKTSSTSHEQTQIPIDQPSTSGTQNSKDREREPKEGPSSESKRLRSAITVVNNARRLRSSTSDTSSHGNSSKSFVLDENSNQRMISNVAENSDTDSEQDQRQYSFNLDDFKNH